MEVISFAFQMSSKPYLLKPNCEHTQVSQHNSYIVVLYNRIMCSGLIFQYSLSSICHGEPDRCIVWFHLRDHENELLYNDYYI